jgi:hypothetical protein
MSEKPADIIFLMSFYIVKGYRVFGDLSFDIRVLNGKEFICNKFLEFKYDLYETAC